MTKVCGTKYTRPRPEDIAQFDALTLHELGRLLAAGRIAYKRKQDQLARDRKRGKV